ncbi:hypothetical protein DSCO28_70790 [Desulfosarcina ovata subsp. sediminis]|uniref:Twitching motility protein PilT n=1 Tax=Desulfosarcina ovata subsp. sediminis TaxID=885957 RepID=A0A5K8A1T6_9BACT|nr:type II toxin-antitoxin system VapC family toxin [Desulfosarcina ovata]BBO86513.1 hypothetical protein DSCO28_70790 [Desulfosarcina ovata subsp. sediminis]
MILILDVSAAVEIVLQRKNGEHFRHHIESAKWVLAPGLFIPEVTNVFWKYYTFGNLSIEQCEKGIDFSINLPDEYCNDKMLYREAFSLSCQSEKPTYDMFYIVLARRNSGYLMTLDKTLATIADRNAVRTITLPGK